MPKKTTEEQYQLYKKIHEERLSLEEIINLKEKYLTKKGEKHE